MRVSGKSRSRSRSREKTSSKLTHQRKNLTELDKGELITKIIETELRLTNKIAKIENDQKDQVLWFAAEIEKCATTNTKLSKIIRNLMKKISNLEERRMVPNQCSHEENRNITQNELNENSPIILPQTEEYKELVNDVEMTVNNQPSHSEPNTTNNREQQPTTVPIDDLYIKLRAFENDFKLSLEGEAVHITSLCNGIDVANGYDRVVADGESLYQRIKSLNQIFRKNS